MSKKIAVILSGCGVYDGAEIHESVMAMLAIDKAGASYQCYAPNIEQHHVINHLTGDEMAETRNVLVESARIARGDIKKLSDLKTDDVDALLLPGGFGAAKNLSSFAFDGTDCHINAEVARTISAFHQAGKPIAALCISPVILAKLIDGATVTMGEDENCNGAVRAMGGDTKNTQHGQVVVDQDNKLVTAPCYMLESRISEIALDAEKAVEALLAL